MLKCLKKKESTFFFWQLLKEEVNDAFVNFIKCTSHNPMDSIALLRKTVSAVKAAKVT